MNGVQKCLKVEIRLGHLFEESRRRAGRLILIVRRVIIVNGVENAALEPTLRE